MRDGSEVSDALYGKTVNMSYAEALEKTENALVQQGFGILCRIDVSATLKKKLEVDFPPYIILGACMPKMAYKALSTVPEIGIMLPCNVVVRQLDGGKSRVEVVNTETMMQMFPTADLTEVAAAVGSHLDNVLETVAG